LLERPSPEIRKILRQIKKQTLALQSIRHLNKIQKLIWFEWLQMPLELMWDVFVA